MRGSGSTIEGGARTAILQSLGSTPSAARNSLWRVTSGRLSRTSRRATPSASVPQAEARIRLHRETQMLLEDARAVSRPGLNKLFSLGHAFERWSRERASCRWASCRGPGDAWSEGVGSLHQRTTFRTGDRSQRDGSGHLPRCRRRRGSSPGERVLCVPRPGPHAVMRCSQG